MSEESTTRGVLELVRRYVEAASRHDFDAVEAFYAPDAVLRGAQIGTFEGRAAARRVLEEVCAPYEEFRAKAEEVLDLGFGVTFAVVVVTGRLGGSSADVRFRFASVAIWKQGLVERQTNYTDIDEAATPPNVSPRSVSRRCRRRTWRSFAVASTHSTGVTATLRSPTITRMSNCAISWMLQTRQNSYGASPRCGRLGTRGNRYSTTSRSKSTSTSTWVTAFSL
jgi:ketosteroid isomerase-like protein